SVAKIDNPEASTVTVTAQQAADSVKITVTSNADNEATDSVKIKVIEAPEFDPDNVYVGPDVALSTAAKGTELNPFPTITEGVDEVNAKGNVYVADGTYKENVLIDDAPLSIIGESEAGVIIDGGTAPSDSFGIQVDKVDGVNLEKLTLTDATRNLKIQFSDDVTLTDVTARNSSATNIDFFDSSDVTLNNVTAEGAEDGAGVSFKDGNELNLNGVHTTGNKWGGVAFYSTKPVDETSGEGISDVTISADSSFGEEVPVYTEL